MFQPIDQNGAGLDTNGKPYHPKIIQNDEIVDLVIDLETMDGDEIYAKYFCENE